MAVLTKPETRQNLEDWRLILEVIFYTAAALAAVRYLTRSIGGAL